MKTLLISLIFILSCSMLRSYSPGERRGIKDIGPAHPDTKDAVRIALDEYAVLYPEYAQDTIALTDVKVYWTYSSCDSEVSDRCLHEPCPKNRDYCVRYGDRVYGGIMWYCTEIYVGYRDKISFSSLLHEIGHCTRSQIYGDPDTIHLDEQWWNENRAINIRLRDIGY